MPSVLLILLTAEACLPSVCRPSVFDAPDMQVAVLSISRAEQMMVAVSGCVIKPAYMLLSLLLILLIRKKKEMDLRLIRWSLAAFLVGEGFCAANYLLAGGESALFEILHGLGMVGLWIFLPWGFFRLIDERVVGFSDPQRRCAVSQLCRRCWKNQDVLCGLSRMLPYAAAAIAVISLMPLAAPLKPFKTVMTVNGVQTVFKFSAPVLFFELRLYPILGALLTLLSGLLLKFGKSGLNKSEALFFAGFGFMFYALFRFVLLEGYDGIPQWMNFWEETTELMMISLVAYFLVVFRKGLNIKLPRIFQGA